jgi:DNA-binding transcriptional MerR regulator
MTIKEIAELCGVSGETVRRWVHEIIDPTQNVEGSDDPAKNWQGLVIKLEEAEKSGTTPADFTLEETLAIIGEGGKNKALASLLAENATNKNAVTAKTANPFPTRRMEELAELMEQVKKRLEDPKEAAYKELEAFISRNLTPERGDIFSVYAWELYHK